MRLAEFDELFATSAREVDQISAMRARPQLVGPAGLDATVRDLIARETECCSFFDFAVAVEPNGDGETVVLDVTVPPQHGDVL
ncbi:hypothetical protein [Micromonospora peucetia]|uniref:hypothetical protein n=1 Tax=Micromonospora peucetia TaxID=47871 RepID=UPI001FE1F8C5|nr:hypothetical protein [Micromonospora peucetia]